MGELAQKILVAGLTFLALLVETHETNELLYITTNLHSNSNCSHNQSCLTFLQFVNSFLPHENATLVFLTGYHTLTEGQYVPDLSLYYIYGKNLAMVGINTEVIIHDTEVSFFGVQKLQIENLILNNGLFHMFQTLQVSLFSLTLNNYVIYIEQATQAKLYNCTFSNEMSQLIVHESKVLLSGNSKFFNNYNSAIVSYSSTIILSGTVSFINNTGIKGGAMALYSSTLHLSGGSNISFINNSARQTGGAIHIEPDMTRNDYPKCFYSNNNTYLRPGSCQQIILYYSENSAQLGGDNIYGTSLALCKGINKLTCTSNVFASDVSMSSVSSDPRQVCLCNSDGQPQCKNASETLTRKSVHPGEIFTILAVIVGGDYGTTIGTVHASFTSTSLSAVPVFEANHQYSQWIDNISVCTDLEYTIYSKHIGQNFIMSFIVHSPKHTPKSTPNNTYLCHLTPLCHATSTQTFINLTVLPCPVGFSLLEKPPTCECNPILTQNGVKCSIVNGKGYFSWNNTLWVNITDKSFIYAKYCPLYYCDPAGKQIEVKSNPSAQCAYDRAGRLCGGCKENYSLAIGSSHCIHCPNNNSLALLIFFGAAGFLLVFFINVLDITLTQGLIDGLIFYANIVWTYQSVLFPEQHDSNGVIIFLKTFIAWLNLDFGIETCFVKGLTSYWKTWLEFVFPFYIWAIVGMMIFTARHSRILTKLYGNRAVPVLATLFLLSYMKLLRTVTSIYMFSDLLQYPEISKVTVWSVDGNVDYFGLPHSFLLVAALIVQLFLWLPYTLTLLFYQQLQKISHVKLFNWVTNLKPFFDVHFAPFKPSHRYWFGVLLLARGVLLVIFSSSFATPKNTNLLLLHITIIILFFYMAIVQPYKNKVTLIIQNSYFANILLLSAFVLYAETHDNKYTLRITAIGISIGVIFSQLCGIIICNVIRLCYCTKRNSYRYRENFEDEQELEENFSTTYRAYIMKALF